MTTQPLYEIVAYEILAEPNHDGTIPPKLDVARFATFALTPADAVRAWADRLADEEAS